MANILQVTSPETNIESNQGIRTGIQTGGGQVGNAGRVQIQPKGQNADAAAAARGESAEAADFESNYAAFLTKLQASDSLPEELTELLFHDGEVLLQSENSEIAGLMQELFAGIEMESPEDLLQFMQSQTDGQMKFSGTFFDGIRNILKEDISGPYQEAVMRFIRSYNSYTSGSHLLNQLHTLGQQASGQMLKAYRGNFENLLDRMNWMAENGDREANTRLLNNEIIPFLSKYISRTHDYGAIRRTAVLFSLYSVKYEEGSEKELVSAFRRLSRNSDFRALFDGDPEKALVKKLAELRERESGDGFSDAFSQLLLKGAQGRTGSESVSRYYQVLNSLLLHESAYMPLLHMLLPFRYQN
ncbi:MAG: hypothetical protein LIV24_09800, partial [Eubacterium sp.]|nr:hypothetical protein [Eubacterium sp.]